MQKVEVRVRKVRHIYKMICHIILISRKQPKKYTNMTQHYFSIESRFATSKIQENEELLWGLIMTMKGIVALATTLLGDLEGVKAVLSSTKFKCRSGPVEDEALVFQQKSNDSRCFGLLA